MINDDLSPELKRDIVNIAGISAIPSLLNVICKTTGMGFAAVARVTDKKWITCVSRDEIGFGLSTGDELVLETTLCNEILQRPRPIVIEHVEEDAEYLGHHTPARYGFQSYVSFPIFRRDGGFFGILCAIDPMPAKLKNRETTELFELFSQLITYHLGAVEDLERLTTDLREERSHGELRETFIAILAHDLRNPVGATRMGIDVLMQTEDLSDKGAEMALAIKSTTYRMQGLIDNLLGFAKGNLGEGIKLEITTDGKALRASIDQIVGESRTLDPERMLTASVELDHQVACDPQRIGQLLSNLLSNAVKHGDPTTPIHVNVSTQGGKLSISVSNGGREIGEEKRRDLFKPFMGRDNNIKTL